jgi:hypothetical protein
MIVSDAPNGGITYDRHYDNRNSFIIQASGQNLGAEFLTFQRLLVCHAFILPELLIFEVRI